MNKKLLAAIAGLTAISAFSAGCVVDNDEIITYGTIFDLYGNAIPGLNFDYYLDISKNGSKVTLIESGKRTDINGQFTVDAFNPFVTTGQRCYDTCLDMRYDDYGYGYCYAYSTECADTGYYLNVEGVAATRAFVGLYSQLWGYTTYEGTSVVPFSVETTIDKEGNSYSLLSQEDVFATDLIPVWLSPAPGSESASTPKTVESVSADKSVKSTIKGEVKALSLRDVVAPKLVTEQEIAANTAYTAKRNALRSMFTKLTK